MNHCMWAVLHLGKDGDEFGRILKNLEVRKVQTIIETVQAQMDNLIYRDSEVFGSSSVPELFDYGWTHISVIGQPIGELLNTEVFVFSDSVLCLGGKCPEYPGSVKARGTPIEYFVQSKVPTTL